MTEIYLSERFCAVTEESRLVEYISKDEPSEVGMILTGKVNRIMKALDCAFVDIGREKDGFLPLDEKILDKEPIRSGDRVLVQIRKEEYGGKGAFLTRDLAVAGKHLMLMPANIHVGVSRRFAEENRAKQEERGKKISRGEYGIVVRKAAEDEKDETLEAEWEALKEKWEIIRETGEMRTGAEEEILREYGDGARICRVDALPADLKRQKREAEGRKVRLPHGGNIVIDRCEAMSVIDVNSAGDAGREKRETVMETNLEACAEIAIQVRLRNLSGILIIDMIDMDDETDRERVMDELKKCFSRDRVKTVIHGWTRLGLIEMTRKRGRKAWQ